MKNLNIIIIVGLLGVLILASMTLYTVDQRQNAMVFQLGEVVAVDKNPGLYFKLPLVQKVRYFDTRILTLDPADPDRFITSEKKNVLVDYFGHLAELSLPWMYSRVLLASPLTSDFFFSRRTLS